MADSNSVIAQYKLDGTTQLFNIPYEYLSKNFIVVQLISSDTSQTKVLTYLDEYTFNDSTTIKTVDAWDNSTYEFIQIVRDTSTELIVDFQDGSVIKAADLNTSQRQSIAIAEEARGYVDEKLNNITESVLAKAEEVLEAEQTLQKLIDENTDQLNRAIRIPASDALTTNELPSKSDRANKLLAFDENGQPEVIPATNGSAEDVFVELKKNTGAELVYTNDGSTVQDKIISLGSSISTVTSDLSNNSDASKGDALIGVLQPYSNAVARTQHDKNTDVLSVKDFGAKGDGSTDDTTAIQNAVNTAASLKRALFFPSGIYITGTITLPAYSNIFGEYVGEGHGTVLRGKGTGDVLYGLNSDSCFGTTVPATKTDYAHHVTISNMEIDGNVNGVKTAFSTSTTGRGIAIWGGSLNIHDVDIVNCGRYALQTGYNDTDVEWGHYFRESSFRNIRIRNIGQHGWYAMGPHDSKIVDVSIINASQTNNSTYDGFYALSGGSFDIVSLHVSSSGNLTNDYETKRHRYAGNFEASCRVTTSSFEGATSAAVRIASKCQFDSSCYFYSPWGDGTSATLVLFSGGNLSTLRGGISADGAWKTGMTVYGIRFDATAPTSGVLIDVTVDGCCVPVSFGSSTSKADGDAGNNDIKVKSYYSGSLNYTVYGVANTANNTKLLVSLSGSQNYNLNSRVQTKTVTVAAGASTTWTYKYPFSGIPCISTSIASPSADATKPVWVSGNGATSVTVYNSTGVSVTMYIVAFEPQLNS